MTKVHCTVNDCDYHANGHNVCNANEILITAFPVPPGDGRFNHHGQNVGDDVQTPVDREDGTYCFTFEKED